MKSRQLFFALALGLSLTAILLLGLTHPTMIVRADPGTFYVRAGATGDCSSTTTPCGSIQQAINLAVAPGDKVWVAAGAYTENLAINHGVQLRGGWNVSFTVQAPLTYPTIVDGSSEHIITASVDAGAALIQGFTLQNGRDGIHLYTGTFTVTGNIVRDVTHQGLEIEDGHILLQDNLITEIAREGIEIDGGAVTVRSNEVYTVGRHAIIVEGGATLIEGNIVRSVMENAENNYHGIEVMGNQVVSGNQVSYVDDRGIYASGGDCIIVNNTVHNTGGDGIRTAASGTHVEIRGNTVYSAGNDGIDARGAAVIVDGNLVYDALDRGVNAEDGALTITNNTIRNVSSDGIRTSGSSTEVEIQGNAIYTAGNDGIDARGDDIFILHNTVNGCADNGIKSESDMHTQIEANWVLDNGVGLAIRRAQGLQIYNNMVGGHITASIELTGTSYGFLYYNTLVGNSTDAQGIGLVILNHPSQIIHLGNNIIVSHNVGISATADTPLALSHTLLWANNKDPISGTSTILAPPLFVAPTKHDYHLLPNSPAIDAGTDGTTDNAGNHPFPFAPTAIGAITGGGETYDIDGDPRLIGDRPDIGADEFPAALRVNKWADPILVQPGAPLTYTILVANTGIVTLTATITDILPDHVSPTGIRVWTPTIPAPSGVWTETVIVTPDLAYIGPLVNVVRAASAEGATDVYTYTLAPGVQVAKRAAPRVAQLGKPLTYTIYVTNTGNFRLNATITDVLPNGVTLVAPHTWTTTLAAPGDVWTATIAITVAADHTGPLVNVVQVASDEGATDIYTHTLTPSLEVVKRASPEPAQAGERLTYTIYVTNTGDFYLHALITDTLPTSVTLRETSGGTLVLPGGTVGVTWTAIIPAPGDVWTQTIVVDTAADYVGPLTNTVRVTTDEGALGYYTLVSSVVEEHTVYLPLILRND